MGHGVIIGQVREADAKRLLLADGSEIVAPQGLCLPDLSLGTAVMVAYTGQRFTRRHLHLDVGSAPSTCKTHRPARVAARDRIIPQVRCATDPRAGQIPYAVEAQKRVPSARGRTLKVWWRRSWRSRPSDVRQA